jgi:hypothetical protein
MNPKTFTSLAVALALLGAAIALPFPAAADAAGAPAAPAAAATVPPAPAAPLLLDTADLGLGATVVFRRVPTAAEIHDLEYFESVSHVLLQLPAWPADADALQPLAQMTLPEGADLVVVLPGYPENRSQVAAWNLLRRPVRIILVVQGPPADREMVFQLNALRGLERVIADVERPSRSGFERLQRPLGFRVVMP